MSRTHLPERNLDVLRAIAVLCVVADHIMWACGWKLPFMSDWELGRVGVLLFFVHTSLVLMSSIERGGLKSHWVRDFYIRRAFRIYPLAIAAVLITVVLRIPPIVPAVFVAPLPRTIASNMLLIQNLTGDNDIMGMLWSLPVEVQMYVALPVLYLLARRSATMVIIVFIGAILAAFAVQYVPLPGVWRLSVALFGPCFVSGVLAFAILHEEGRARLPSWMWLPVLVAAVSIFVLLRPLPQRAEPGWLFCLSIGVAIPFIQELRASPFTRAAKTICTYSYGIYLLLTPAIWIGFVTLRNRPIALQWIALLAALIALPWTAYKVVEHPGITMGRKFTRSNQQLASTTPAP